MHRVYRNSRAIRGEQPVTNALAEAIDMLIDAAALGLFCTFILVVCAVLA